MRWKRMKKVLVGLGLALVAVFTAVGGADPVIPVGPVAPPCESPADD
jgi:hypothetical protein